MNVHVYTKTTLDKVVGLTTDLHDVFERRGATLYLEGEEETVLDGIVAERPPMSSYAVVFEEGLTGLYTDTLEEELVEMDIEPGEVSDEFKRLIMLDGAELLLEILKLNPEIEELDLQSASFKRFNSSVSRLDGFGGSGLIVNRKGYLCIATSNYEIDEDGIIQARAAFRFWDDHQTVAERDEAACGAS
jgi:hypothetical protein